MKAKIPSQIFTLIVLIATQCFADELPADHRPVISPDGEKVVFMSTREGGDWELFMIKIDGTGLKRLTENAGWDGYAVWAPDGESFLFDREIGGSRGAYKYDLAAATISPFILIDDARVAVSGWSTKSGKVVMFIERDDKRDLYIADSDGSNMEQLTDTPDRNEHDAHFSPDGNKLAFAVSYDGGSSLDVMDLETGSVSRYVSSTQNLYGLDWSPDGTRVAFTDTPNDNPDGNAEIYVLNLADSEVLQITNNEDYDHMPVWLPDDNGIMFSSYASGREEIYIINLENMEVSNFP